VTNNGKLATLLCSGAAILALALGYGADGNSATTGASSSGTPAPAVPTAPGAPPGGALPVQPVGGGGCIIGLNCGCIPRITCPGSHRRTGGADGRRPNVPSTDTP
jgi:hypothetical protein